VTADQQAPVFGASVKMLLYGDAFRPTYNRGDNTGLIATDSMKNFTNARRLIIQGRIWNSTAIF
jgi:urate oxidase